MGNKRPQAFTEEVCSGLKVRLARYKFLLHDYQTPLFHNQLLDAIRLHEEIVQAPNPTPAEHERVLDQIVVLDNMNDRLNKHWDELHKSMDFRAILLANISLYQSKLGAWLILDYTGKCSTNCTWASSTLGHINNVGSGGVGNIHDDYRLYQQTFVRPLKEMMLNQDHVKKRLRIAATGSTRPAGMIYHLIDRCDWGALAYAVINDRELAVTLFGAKQLNPGFWSPQFGACTVQKIDDIRDKYFDELSTPEKYTISNRARKLSAKKAASAAHPSPPPPFSSASSPRAEEASALVVAKSIYNKVVSGLAFEGAGLTLRSIVRRNTQTTSPWAGSDSTTQLIDPSEKEKD
jgi:hypothetical protein